MLADRVQKWGIHLASWAEICYDIFEACSWGPALTRSGDNETVSRSEEGLPFSPR